MTIPREIQIGDYVLDLQLKVNYDTENVGRVLEICENIPPSNNLLKVVWIDTKQTEWTYECYLELIPDEDVPMTTLRALGSI